MSYYFLYDRHLFFFFLSFLFFAVFFSRKFISSLLLLQQIDSLTILWDASKRGPAGQFVDSSFLHAQGKNLLPCFFPVSDVTCLLLAHLYCPESIATGCDLDDLLVRTHVCWIFLTVLCYSFRVGNHVISPKLYCISSYSLYLYLFFK